MTHSDMLTRYSRASLSLDSVGSQTDEESSNPSPASASTTDSPLHGFPPCGSLLHRTLHDVKLEDDRMHLVHKAALKVGREKRKRSRVTPDQLTELENVFMHNRSPTAQERRALSDRLKMNERQTQIWFQNRRAKAKVQDGKPGAQSNAAEASKSSPTPSSQYDTDVQIVHEDQPVHIIPCTDLTIGTWRRVSSGANTHDLVAYVCNGKQCLNWFIRSNGYGFKMEIPFTAIMDTEYKILGDRTGVASFALSHPPIFYLENISSPLADKPAVRSWKRCSDWTEGHQASQVLRHTVVGSDAHLTNVLRSLHSSSPTGALSVAADYRSDRVIATPMELPPPPLAALNREGPSYHEVEIKGYDRAAEYRRRSLYSPQEDRYADHDERNDLRSPPHSAPAPAGGPFSRSGFIRPAGHFDSGMYTDYPSNLPQRSDASAFSVVSPGLAIYPRPQVLQQQPYFQDYSPQSQRMPMQPFHQDMSRAPQAMAYPTPSPPLMVSKYEIDMSRDRIPHQISPQSMHEMPNMLYDAENGMRSR